MMDRVTSRPLDLLREISPPERAAWLSEHGERDVLHAIGQQLQSLCFSDIGNAVETSGWLIDAAHEFGDQAFLCRVLCLRAFVLSVANRFDEAMQILERASAIANQTGDLRSRAGVAQTSVQPLVRLGRYQDAIESAERAIQLYEEAGDTTAVARAHSNLGVVHRMLDNPEKALIHFDRALPGMESDQASIAQVQSNRAEALLDLVDFRQAEAAFRSALMSFREADMDRAAAIVAGNLADLLGQQGRLNESMTFFERARSTFEAGGAEGDAARIESESAEVLATVGLLEDAMAVADRSARVLLEHGMRREAARALLVHGSTARRLGDRSVATECLTRAAAIGAELGWRLIVGRANVEAARVAIDDRDFRKAEQLLGDAIRDLASETQERASALVLQAHTFRETGRPADAAAAVQDALSIAERIGSLPIEARALHERALQAEQAGNSDVAMINLQNALSKVERQRGVMQSDRARSAWAGGHSMIYEDLCHIALQQGSNRSLEVAFGCVERARSRSLLELIQTGTQSADQILVLEESATADLVNQHQRAKGELAALYSWSRFEEERGTADGMRVTRQRRADELERHLTQLEGRLSTLKQNGAVYSEPIGLEDAAALVSDREAIVEYFECRGSLGAFVMTSGGVTAIRHLCDINELSKAIEAARFQIDRGVGFEHSDQRSARLLRRAVAAFRTVHDLALAPIRKALGDVDRCVFVPTGRLHGFPIAALHDGNHWLVQDMHLAMAPSVSVLSAMKTAAASRSFAVRVVGCGDAQAPEIEAEAADLSKMYGATSELLLGAEATAERVFGRLQPGQILHLACHGDLGGSDPLSARLRLADRWLTARELIALDLKGSRVILSCCDVGRGRLQRGDELFGMLRSLLAGGASSVVAGFWPAHDVATKELMLQLHAHLQSGDHITLGRALCGAQRGLLTSQPHPSRWATFSIVGAE